MKSDANDETDDLRPLTDRERKYVRLLGNQYASLSIAITEAVQATKPDAAPAGFGNGTMSRADFKKECRRIFRRYTPQLGGGRLRDPHRAFIERNLNRQPEERYLLARALGRYDLSSLSSSIEPQFNRERDDDLDTKLKQIERTVLRTES